MALNIILMGPPGCGKGAQAKKLLDNGGWTYLSMGDQLRKKLSLTDQRLASGQLVNIELTNEVLQEFVAQHGTSGILLDGFPRDVPQVNKMVELGVRIDLIILIDLSFELIKERITGRLLHVPSGRTYHKTLYPPKVVGLDDLTQEPLIARPEDNIIVIRDRIKIYEEQAEKVLTALTSKDSVHYKKFRAVPKVHVVKANHRDVESIAEEIKKVVDDLTEEPEHSDAA
jgi:adenylate kinase